MVTGQAFAFRISISGVPNRALQQLFRFPIDENNFDKLVAERDVPHPNSLKLFTTFTPTKPRGTAIASVKACCMIFWKTCGMAFAF
jgi:hypothetical protein